MAQLERKIGIGQNVDTVEKSTGMVQGIGMDTIGTAEEVATAVLDYELASLDDSDLHSAIFGDESGTRLAQHHQLQDHEQRGLGSSTKFLLWFLLIVHMSGLFIWFRVWMRDRRVKSARTGKMTPPPQRQSCTYDVDNRLISKLELPLKALKLARA